MPDGFHTSRYAVMPPPSHRHSTKTAGVAVRRPDPAAAAAPLIRTVAREPIVTR